MKLRVPAAILGACMLLSANGCSFLELGLDDALRPPKTMGDEAEIEKLISESAKGSYILKYPKNGNYRSAIITQDLDGDDTAEAIAFFRGKDEATRLHMLVMYETDDGWKVSGDFVTETTDVDCVDFAKISDSGRLDILTGYTTYSPNVSFLSCYSYRDGETTSISAGQSYSAFYCGSLEQSDRSEVVTLSLYSADNEAKATLLEYNSDKRALYAKSSVAMDPSIVSFRHVIFGDLGGGVRGLAVDGAYADEQLCTQIIYYNRDLAVLRNPLYREKAKNITQRTAEVFCEDNNSDGLIDIPTVERLPYENIDARANTADLVTRHTFNAANEELVRENDYALNPAYNFCVKIPESWEAETFTAQLEDNAMRFFEWTGKTLGSPIFEIRAFEAAKWEQGKETDGYTLIYRDNRYAYALKNSTDQDSRYSLTDDEIKTSFSLLGDTG